MTGENIRNSNLCFINKVLLEHSHSHLFTYGLWLLSSHRDRVESL